MFLASSWGSDENRILDSLEPGPSNTDFDEAIEAGSDSLLVREENFDSRKASLVLENVSTGLKKHEEKDEITSNSEVSSDPYRRQRIDVKQVLVLGKLTAEGSNGTIIWDGSCDIGTPVFVRSLPKTHEDVAFLSRNFQLLKKSPCHPNIVRYHAMTSHQDVVHFVQEPFLCNLEEFVKICHPKFYEEVTTDGTSCSTTTLIVQENARLESLEETFRGHHVNLTMTENGYPSPLLLKLMRDMASGLAYLHNVLGIAHGNLRPDNVLIVMEGSSLCAKLSDMGFPHKRSSSGCDNLDWQAPELRGGLGCPTREADMYSLGRIFSFCITGIQPFGDTKKVKNRRSSSSVDCPEAYHLISCLTSKKPTERLTTKEVLLHPVFWRPETRVSFLCDTSDKVGNNKRTNLCKDLEKTARPVIVGIWNEKRVKTWDARIDNDMIIHMNNYRKQKEKPEYDFSSMRELVRFIRNMMVHYEKLPIDVKETVGPLHEGFDSYFKSRFPDLLIEIYKVVLKYYKKEKFFCRYFDADDVSVAN